MRKNRTISLETVSGVQAILANIHHIRSLRFSQSGHMASDIYIDYTMALSRAGLTEKQKQAIHLVYESGYTQSEAAAYMGCSQQAVQQHIKASLKKISDAHKGYVK